MTLDGTIPAGFASCSPLVLNAGLPAPVDLYVRYPGDSTMVLFLSAGQQFSADELKRIESHDLRLMYEPQNHSTMHMVLQEQLIRYLGSPKIPDIRQAAMMVEVLRGELAQALATQFGRTDLRYRVDVDSCGCEIVAQAQDLGSRINVCGPAR